MSFFLSRFIFACCLVLYLYACAVENPEIPGFCVSKSRGLHTDHKRVKKIEIECFSVTQTNLEQSKTVLNVYKQTRAISNRAARDMIEHLSVYNLNEMT